MDSWLYDPDAGRSRRNIATYGPDLLPRNGVAVVAGASNTGKSTWLLAMMHYWGCRSDPEYDDDIMGYEGWGPSFWYFAFEDSANMRNAYDGFRAAYTNRLSLQNPDRGYRRLQDDTWDWHCKEYKSLFTPPAGSLDLTDAESVEVFCEAACRIVNVQTLNDGREPDIIIIDNMSLCIGDADENESITARKVVRGLERIREYFGASLIILVHHTARDSNRLRGSEVLFNLAQGVVILSGTGDTVTAHCTKMKGKERDAKRKYRRTPMQGPAASYVDYVDITNAAAKPAKAAPAPKASPEPAEALQAPVGPAAPALTPPATKHPAEGLRGLPLEVWQLLALGTGEGIAAEAAKAKALTLPTFEAIEPRRRNDRWCDVLKTFTNKGVHDPETGLILNR